MNNNGNNDYNVNDEIDLVDFSSSQEMERIRENERIEREKRRARAIRLRREEIRRQKRMQQIKQRVIAWGIIALAVMVVVALIIGIVSLFAKEDKPKIAEAGDKLSDTEIATVSNFARADVIVYNTASDEKADYSKAINSLVNDVIKTPDTDDENAVVNGSELAMLAETYLWNSGFGNGESIRTAVRNYPMYSNGYVWSTEKSMMSTVTGGYLYDTNAAYISAVCEICILDGSLEFLDSVDDTGEEKGDISRSMTVGEKLDAAINHFFDTADYLNGGGVRYNESDGLVYVRTAENNGTSTGKPSNLFFNYRFGYVDTYINLTFNKAMQDLERLYTFVGNKEKAERFAGYAQKNKQAINNKLYNSSLGRYVACIDDNGKMHDNGFTAINLMAVSFGIAENRHAENVLSWIEGESNVQSDTLESGKILGVAAMPLFSTTQESGNWWYLGNKYPLTQSAEFGEYWMNGAPSALSGNYYLLAGKTVGKKEFQKRANGIVSAYDKGIFVPKNEETSEPSLHYALAASNSLKVLFGISGDGKALAINPDFTGSESVGIKDVSFFENNYDVLFDNGTVYVMCDREAAVKLRIGGFTSGNTVIFTVSNGKEIVSSKEMIAGADGFVTVSQKFGDGTYIKLEEIKKEK